MIFPQSVFVELVACDVDGTLVGPELTCSPRVAAALADAAGRARVVLATGRAWPSARRFRDELTPGEPVICAQGAVVRGPDGELWLDEKLPDVVAADAVEFARTRGDEITFYVDDEVWLGALRRPADFYDHWFALPQRPFPPGAAAPTGVTKFLLVANDAAHGDDLAREWRGRFGDAVDIVRSHPLFVEGVAPGVSKGRALAEVAHRLGVSAPAVMAVGDQENDVSMLAWAGLGVALGDAPWSVRAAADVIAPSFAEDGAAWALERYVVAGRR